MIEFNDGSRTEIDGELRLVDGPDGWHVVGAGIYLPAANRTEGELLLGKILTQGIYVAMKMLKSPRFRDRFERELAEWDAEAAKEGPP
jgi:hypothetical protein